MRDYLTPSERRAEKKEIAAAQSLALKAACVRMTENQWRELRFTGRVAALGLVMVGDVASKQHRLSEVSESVSA